MERCLHSRELYFLSLLCLDLVMYDLKKDKRYIGVIEKSISHGIRGWIIDSQNPDADLRVIIEIDDLYSIQRPVNIFRKNLWNGASGNHGFELRLTDIPCSLLSKQLKSIRATLHEGDFECSNSPLEFDRIAIARSVCSLVYSDLQNSYI